MEGGVTAINPWTTSHFKPSKFEAQVAKEKTKTDRVDKESANKSKARKRDGWMCRFPRCFCHVKRLHPEVCHLDHKGSGGDPSGEKSKMHLLICLCQPRHRTSRLSLHAVTLRVEALSAAGMNGPVRWWVDATAIDTPISRRQSGDEQWVVVASESDVRVLEPLTADQGALLERIAEMEA
jgi:hypothetical protein